MIYQCMRIMWANLVDVHFHKHKQEPQDDVWHKPCLKVLYNISASNGTFPNGSAKYEA